jgi:hypothetical protein
LLLAGDIDYFNERGALKKFHNDMLSMQTVMPSSIKFWHHSFESWLAKTNSEYGFWLMMALLHQLVHQP